jgi:diguanylate cyclase (GGDEF)-like protein
MSRPQDSAPNAEPSPVTSNLPPFDAATLLRLLDQLAEGLCLVDPDRRVVYWNGGAEAITGFPAAEVLGRVCHNGPLCDADCRFPATASGRPACPVDRVLRAGVPTGGRLLRTHRDGQPLVLDIQVLPLLDEHRNVIGGVQFFRDASATAELEVACGRLRALAETDALTGLANRRHLDTELQVQLDLLAGHPGHRACVILADLDHFKQINDTWGHGVGDQVLQAFARGLKGQCRPGDLVGRYGGEEFLIILPGIRLADALEVAERMRAITPLAAPPGLHALRPSASFGVAEARATDTPGHLLRRVDAALYRAKRRGRQRVEPQSGEQSPPAA